jgi:hypothetical protein
LDKSAFFDCIRSGAIGGNCWQVAGVDSSIPAEIVAGVFAVLGVIILAPVAYREGWEAVLFLLIFLAIWQLDTIEPAGEF